MRELSDLLKTTHWIEYGCVVILSSVKFLVTYNLSGEKAHIRHYFYLSFRNILACECNIHQYRLRC